MSDLAAIRDWIREETLVETTDWSNTKINAVINEGLRAVSTRFPWPFLATSNTLTVVADQQAYTFDTISDFSGTGKKLFRIEAIVDNDGRVKLNEVAAADAFTMYGGDMPAASTANRFFTWGNSIYLIPTPDTNDTARYTVFYYQSAVELSNETDTPEWDSRFHMVLADYGIARVWEREEEIGKSQAADQRFDQGVERMAQFYLNRAQDYPAIFGGGKSGVYHDRRDRANMPWLQ